MMGVWLAQGVISAVSAQTAGQTIGQTGVPTTAQATDGMATSPQGVRTADDLGPKSVRDWEGEGRAPGPLRRVARGPAARGLPIADRQIEVRYQWQGRDWTLDDYMETYRVSGVMALRDGQIVLERYGQGRGPTDRWASMSVAKSVTSVLAGAAIADGKLRLDDPVTRLVPELAGSAYDGVTVRELLTMSSGVRWNEDYSDPRSDLAKYYARAFADEAMIGYLRDLPRESPPGSTWHYNTAETHLAGLVISRAVGRTLSDYLSEKIWRPYGMARDAYWMTDRQGREAAGCCLYMTLADQARFGQFVLDGAAIDGVPVMAPGYLAEATTVRISNDQPAPWGYGYYWWIGPRAYEAVGINGQSILVYPKERLVIAVNSAWPRPVGEDLSAALHAFQGAVHDAAAPEFPPARER